MDKIHRADVKINGEIEGSMMIDGIEFRGENDQLMLGAVEEYPEVTKILNELVGKSYASVEELKQDVAQKAVINKQDVTIT